MSYGAEVKCPKCGYDCPTKTKTGGYWCVKCRNEWTG